MFERVSNILLIVNVNVSFKKCVNPNFYTKSEVRKHGKIKV